MRKRLRESGLTLVLISLFLLFLVGQALSGWHSYNADQTAHHAATVGLWGYLGTGHFGEAVFENWESEFLQMGSFVLFTVFFFQKGSPESKELGKEDPTDADPRRSDRAGAPWPVRRGGWVLKLYENSLGLAFVALFLFSITMHMVTGAAAFNEEQKEHHESQVSVARFATTSEFWFQSLQNWQSEYLSAAAMVYLSVYLRQRGSAESKPVAASNSEHD
jgi:hypothetical protein